MSKKTRNKRNKLNVFPAASLTVLGVIFLFIALTLFNLQSLKDNFIVWTRPVSSETIALVVDSGMSPNGQFFYKASEPVLAQADEFNEACRHNHEQSEAILGCYVDQKVYVYSIKDERLEGIREVTASHEALHAVYERLSTGEKVYINDLLDKEYSKLAENDELRSRMDYYERTEPGQFHNELHSIIGTEKSEISRSLEEYYKKYFDDRQKVVKLHLGYSNTIKELIARADRLSKEILNHKTQVEEKINKYNNDVNNVNARIASFNANASTAGYFKSQTDFLQVRKQLANSASALDSDFNLINKEIKRHDELVREYNEAAVIANDVNKSLNSTLAPRPSL